MVKINLQIAYTVTVKDKHGKVTFRKKGISKSLLRNFMYWLQSKFTITGVGNYATSWTTADTSNTSRTFPCASLSAEGVFGYFGAVISQSVTGLRVGLLDTAVNPTDYELASLIVHGTGTDQMNYGGQTVEAVAVAGQNVTFRVTRAFTNNSGTTITVKEIGGAMTQVDSGALSRYLLYLRDVLPSSVPVPDGSTFTLRYTFTVTA